MESALKYITSLCLIILVLENPFANSNDNIYKKIIPDIIETKIFSFLNSKEVSLASTIDTVFYKASNSYFSKNANKESLKKIGIALYNLAQAKILAEKSGAIYFNTSQAYLEKYLHAETHFLEASDHREQIKIKLVDLLSAIKNSEVAGLFIIHKNRCCEIIECLLDIYSKNKATNNSTKISIYFIELIKQIKAMSISDENDNLIRQIEEELVWVA